MYNGILFGLKKGGNSEYATIWMSCDIIMLIKTNNEKKIII
jgi:hypothetical protein